MIDDGDGGDGGVGSCPCSLVALVILGETDSSSVADSVRMVNVADRFVWRVLLVVLVWRMLLIGLYGECCS